MAQPLRTATNFESKVAASLVASVLVVLGLAGLSWRMVEDASDADHWVAHTHEVLRDIDAIRLATVQIELFTQGFRFMQDPALIEQRNTNIEARRAALLRVKGMTQDSPAQQENLARLQDVLIERQAISMRVEELTRTQGSAAASAYARSAPLQETRERAYGILARIQGQEEQLLKDRLVQQRVSRLRFAAMGGVFAALMLATLVWTFHLTRRHWRAHRQAQDALAQSEERLDTTLQSIGDAVVTTDVQACIVSMNPVAERLTGWTLPEARGRNVAEVFHIVHAHTRQPAAIPVNQALSSGEVQALASHTVLIARDGTERPIADSAAPIRDRAGHIQGVVLVFRDVTSEDQAERIMREQNQNLEQLLGERSRQLQASEVRYRTVFVTNPDAVVLASFAQGQVIEVNDGFQRLLGWPAAYAADQTLASLGLWKNPAEGQAFLELMRTQGHCESLEALLLRRDGSTLDASLSANVVSIDGKSCLLMVIRDISERKATEAELIRYRDDLEALVVQRTAEVDAARQSAEEANRAKSLFLANMSHEIRTPLNAIAGMSRLIRNGPLTDQQADRLGKLEAAAQHLHATINDILDLSKIESGKLELSTEPLLVPELVQQSLAMLQERAQSKGLQLRSTCAPLPDNLYGDKTRVEQALLNYLSNAIKFTDSGAIDVRALLQSESDDSAMVRFEVQDQGIGIAPESMDKLFAVFQQADSTTSRKYGGTGLGLAITRKLAEAMHGQAGAISRVGSGSTFWFTVRLSKGLPVAQRAPELHGDDVRNTLLRECTGRRVLLAEDDAFNREIGHMLLAEVGLMVDLAEDGQRAVAMAQLQSYDIILMDLQMPTLDGLEATRQIRHLLGRALPIVAMTANAFEEDRRRCLEAGMDDFLTKPIDPDLLYRCLLRYLRAPTAH